MHTGPANVPAGAHERSRLPAVRECVLADDLTMAFSSNDIDKLDKVKKLPEVNYLDFEVQRLCKGLSLFDSIYTDDTPINAKQPVSVPRATHRVKAHWFPAQ